MITAKKKSNKDIRFSLALTIGVIITILLIALGFSITFYTYNNQKNTTLDTTEKIFEISSQQTEEKLYTLIHTVESFVSVSSALESIGGESLENLSLLLPYFHQSFVTLPWMDSFYVGYNSGAFYMIHAVRDNELIRSVFSAPDNTEYAVKMIHPGSESNSQESLFYDRELKLLERRKGIYDGYDPRKRDWYIEALSTKKTIVTGPYTFFSSRQVGITAAHVLERGEGVVGADTVLAALSGLLQKQKLTPSTEIVILKEDGEVVLSAGEKDLVHLQEIREKDEKAELHVSDLSIPAAHVLYQEIIAQGGEGGKVIEVNGEKWFGHGRKLMARKRGDMHLAIIAPFDELMTNAQMIRQRNLLIMLSVLIAAVGVGLYLSRLIAASLHDLSNQAESIRDFKLTAPLNVQSRISEVDGLADTMTVMQSAINRFVEIARALSAEKDMERVLEMIVSEAQSITGADGGAIGLVSDDGKSFSYVLVRNMVTGVHFGGSSGKEVPLAALVMEGDADVRQESVELSVVSDAKTKVISDVSLGDKKVYSNIRKLYEREGYVCSSLLIIPLLNRQDEVIGLLHLLNARDSGNEQIIDFSEHKVAYVKALSSNAALALDNNRLIRAQKDLFDSFVRLIAGAIDTKSPYTGGHCQRVPVTAGMLADAASADTTPALTDFHLSEDERYELFIASWLHDCGKVTTPEYVVDKATKLETIYNRIHEIRVRFEVLWRDADIDYYKGIVQTPENRERLQEVREEMRQQLQDDFAFVAESNVGGEFMAPERVKRLQEIGSRIWQQNFDHRLGISSDEAARLDMAAELSFPVSATLLADKAEHILPRLDGGDPYGDNPWNFVMSVPEHRYNLGELYNLSIARGTLTAEERYKINDHIVQTISMLNSLPFPREIRRVPEWAGNHHETMDGSGYPRGLTADQLTIPERIMAVADIFEALTAADRPYKTPKALSTCIKIMSFMRNDGHICPDLFELLLKSGIYLEYAEKYMRPEQLDEVDVSVYLK